MLTLTNTENYLGVHVSGDFQDLDKLYESLHSIVGQEGEFRGYSAARLRVLGVCYDLRHAMMGNREIVRVPNGMDKDTMRMRGEITSEENVYLRAQVYWPEMLFVTIALNDFIQEYAFNKTKSHDLQNKTLIWDQTISQVKMFQSAVADLLKETLPSTSFTRTRNLLVKNHRWTVEYRHQFLDVWNIRFIEMDADERLQNLTIVAKRLAERGKEYREIRKVVEEAAEEYGCSPEEVRLQNVRYPDWEYDW